MRLLDVQLLLQYLMDNVLALRHVELHVLLDTPKLEVPLAFQVYNSHVNKIAKNLLALLVFLDIMDQLVQHAQIVILVIVVMEYQVQVLVFAYQVLMEQLVNFRMWLLVLVTAWPILMDLVLAILDTLE